MSNRNAGDDRTDDNGSTTPLRLEMFRGLQANEALIAACQENAQPQPSIESVRRFQGITQQRWVRTGADRIRLFVNWESWFQEFDFYLSGFEFRGNERVILSLELRGGLEYVTTLCGWGGFTIGDIPVRCVLRETAYTRTSELFKLNLKIEICTRFPPAGLPTVSFEDNWI